MSDHPAPSRPPSPEGWEQALAHFDKAVEETRVSLTQVERRLGTSIEFDGDQALVAHLRKNLDFFSVRADGIRTLAAAKAASDRQIADLIERNAELDRGYASVLASRDALEAQVEELDELKVEHALLIEHYNQGERLWGEARIELSDLRGSVDRLMQEKEGLEERHRFTVREFTTGHACHQCGGELAAKEEGGDVRCAECDETDSALRAELQQLRQEHERLKEAQESFLHPIQQVYFRAGLLACREYMARFVEAESPSIAMSIRANWWPSLGPDFGPPRKLDFTEVTRGEFGTAEFRSKTAGEVSPTQEALPIALGFLEYSPLRQPLTEQEPT